MTWQVKRQAEPPTLAQMAARGPLVLCLKCGTYRTVVPALMGTRDGEVIEAHDGARGPCPGSGLPWDDLRAELAGVVPEVGR